MLFQKVYLFIEYANLPNDKRLFMKSLKNHKGIKK